ncbi:electron transfer flavoprotein subunit alpha/FixB family protein [Ancylobacter sp. A5.8]|uniref:electron transfer flavoprotein subunit alpha/FixB family protein n=1 Tax=Ancylobacter gelatini TaxID=2919920 RepID=UPI001F4D9BD3|nr:electron transfer flavoprotein subunit alpha/FixB family protein [Ancylobacter gelatini]MCJ8144774.1 electron transfer flavoprotein subunit alpha/FixB family protein [Ancylobacter gelatini]
MSRLRRDPRAEREAMRIAGGARPRFSREASLPVSARPRRDPRAEIEALLVPGGTRPRLDRLSRGGVRPVRDEATSPSESTVQTRIVTEPAFLVAVVPDAPGGRLTPLDRQLFGAAHLLAAGGGAVLALAEPGHDDLAGVGADRVGPLAAVADYDPEARAAAVAQALESLNIRHALFAETAEGGDLARRVAARLGEPLFAGAESLTPKLVTRPARGRRVEQRRAPPRLVSLVADSVAPYGGASCEARAVELPAPVPTTGAILSAEIILADPATVPLGEAEFVVSAGNGVSDIPSFLDLARALRATPGASRMLCDAGLMPRAAQVGASGTVLGATCYLALGIAGAPQHLQGITGCEHVVAVNTDLHAAMVERAGLAIIADAHAVMPALIAALEDEP